MHRVESDGTDVFTVSRADEDYRFEGWFEEDTYWLHFEEGFGYRGQYLDEVPDACWKELLQSEPLSEAVPSDAERVSRKN